MLETKLFKEVKKYVFQLLKNELPTQAVYHNYNHAFAVVKAVAEIGNAESISDDDMEDLQLAAWFHDVGFVKGFKDHEDEGKKIAKNYLEKAGYNAQRLMNVLNLIEATKMPQNPKTLSEKVICDADLYHLGEENFKETSNLLRAEWEHLCEKELTDIEWLKENDRFFKEHTYFTNYAFEKQEKQKVKNWLRIQKDLKKAIAKNKDLEEKKQLKKSEFERKKAKENRPDRGIETMYRVTLRNHIKLSDIADTKANILLSVSAIILSIALSNLVPKLDKSDNYYLIYPTAIFVIVAVVTIIYSILATRPKVTSGSFSRDDVKNKKVNLLFFGNFYKMSLQDYQEGMKQVINDRDYLYGSLTKDLYFLGIVLQKKYKLLRTAYNIFMIGIIITVLAFIISFRLMRIAQGEVEAFFSF